MNIENNPVKLAVFLSYARDYINWMGAPLPLDGLSAESQMCLELLQERGLLTVTIAGNDLTIAFTDDGAALALEHGVEV